MLSAVLILRYPVHILLCAVLTAAVVTEQTKETVEKAVGMLANAKEKLSQVGLVRGRR